jgi:hypothetical protein
MKHLPIFIISTVVVAALLFESCDNNSVMQQDNIPTPISQVPGAVSGGSQAVVADSNLIPHQYIVVYKSRWKGLVKNTQARQALQFVNARIHELGLPQKAVKYRYRYASRGFDAKLTDEQLKKLKKDPRVKYIEQDRKFKVSWPIGTSSNTAPAVTAYSSNQTIPWGTLRVNGPFDGTGKKAWIIGAGIDLNNTDLNVDVNNSVSFIADESAQDVIGHGTYVAGLLAAIDNGHGVVGVAAGAEVVAVKVVSKDGHYTDGHLQAGIEYVESKASPDDIINMSLGGPTSESIDDAIITGADEGLRFVISAGNNKENAEYFSPARVEHSNVWTVSAFKQGDEFSAIFDYNHCGHYYYGSNYGNPPIEYSEPGERIKSLLRGGGVGMGYGGPCTASGTSYAAPMLAGLLLAAPRGITTDGTVSNDPDGDPDPIAVGKLPPPSLSVSITGPRYVYQGDEPIWTAHPSDGTSPYQYTWFWRRKPKNSPTWTDWTPAPAGDQQSWGYSYNPDLSAIQLKVTVTDADNNTATNHPPLTAEFRQPFSGPSVDSTQTDSTAHHATKMK